MELTFDLAIEILEISDISKVSLENLPRVIKSAKRRWHPDRIAQNQDEQETEKYTQYFQLIDPASKLIKAYLNGTYHAGDKFERESGVEYQEPVEVIRANAGGMQNSIQNSWDRIKQTKFKQEQKEIILSDGFRLSDLLTQDFKEDIAALSIISLIYGVLVCMLIILVVSLILPPLGVVVGIAWFLQAFACILGLLPLSRFWLPDKVQDPMLRLINFGLGIYNWVFRKSTTGSVWVQLLVNIPTILAQGVKWIILFPLVEISKAIVKDKVVGVVKEKVNYYAGGAQWYIEELINKSPMSLSEEELFDLSFLYGEFRSFEARSS